MATHRVKGVAVGLALAVTLGACDQASRPGFLKRDAAAEAPVEGGAAAGTTIEKDVEAPEVFSVSEPGLWDGRPSLGGVWVAHPDVTDPERVLIRNQSTGQFVVGALFRRERDNPGPRIQVSSDAAEALGMLAGQPATLEVVALRREEIEVAPPTDAATETGDAPEAAPPAIEETRLDPIPRAEAAISEAEITAATAGSAPAAGSTDAPAPPAAAPAPSSLDKPYIQIGIFSVEENARNAAQSLRSAGIVPAVREQQSSGKKFWRVLVGPATTEADRRAVLARVRELGYADAYYVTN